MNQRFVCLVTVIATGEEIMASYDCVCAGEARVRCLEDFGTEIVIDSVVLAT
jgi:hypothetical protein